MPTNEVVRGDESDRREVRTIFTNTGHGALNALLIVSGGATVAFLTFLGNAVQQVDLVSRIGEAATRGFATALGYFFASVLYSVLAWGTTYASHAGHHYSASFERESRKSRAYYWVGVLFMWATVVVCVLCFSYLFRGGYLAIDAFRLAADELTRPGVPMVPH
ncbi:MAG TPA: hypothetical protein VK504_08225 [Vicinamibacterales bacterium]|nr:hypothetical protein [Vicinamibacterales bacterium]